MSGERVRLAISDGVARLSLHRPDKRNALDAEMTAALAAHCHEIERSPARAVVLSAEGKVFCAGGDIDSWSALSPSEFARFWIREGHAAFDALARLRQPTIALLEGHVFGGGLELAACADLRIAEAHVKFGQPETGLGVIPGWSGTQRAARRFGAQLVRRMALFGEVFEGEEALAAGLVDRVVASGEGEAAAAAVVERLMGRSPAAVELAKMCVNAAEGEERERVVETLASGCAAASAELREGLAAYREGRRPVYGEGVQTGRKGEET